MIKFLLPAVIILTIVAIAIGFIIYQRRSSPVPSSQISEQISASDAPVSSPEIRLPLSSPLAETSTQSAIVVRINELTAKTNGIPDLTTRIAFLEKEVDDLNTRLTKLENNPQPSTAPAASTTTSTPTSSTSGVGVQYIYALGYGGSSNQTDWSNLSSLAISFDPAQFPGYKSLQLEVLMHVRDGNGKAFARLNAAGTPVTSSETTSTNYQDEWVSSGTFTWSSKANFTFQLKSLTGYDTYLSNARLKINF